MAATISGFGHKFNVHEIATVAVPSARTTWNQFDEHGLVLSLERLRGETNWEYKRRLQDVFVNMANSSYRGMVNGITRELGLALFEPLVINPKVDHAGNFLAPDPYIRFDGAYLYLYSDYGNDMLDWAIDRYEPGGNYEHLYRLAEFVNTTAFFEAHIIEGIDPYTRSMTIVNQSNRTMVISEDAQESTRFNLENDKIVPGSISFSDTKTFRREMSSASSVAAAGQYHINYKSGMVTVGSVPPPGVTIRYQHSEYPFLPKASPVIVHDITSEGFRSKMFAQELQEDGTYELALPTEVGVDIMNELLSVIPMYWGV